MATSRVVRALAIGLVAGAAFAACAQGNQLQLGQTTGTGGGTKTSSHSTSGTGGMPIMPGNIGAPCPDGMCAEGTCTLVGATKYCTTSCPPTCPSGTYCSLINGNPTCVPDLDQECDKCTTAADCKLPSDSCMTAPAGDTFCARDCTVDSMCPAGFTCTDLTSYDQDGGTDAGDAGGGDAGGGGADAGKGDAGAGDAGKTDAGSHDGGGAGGAGTGDAGTGGGGPIGTTPTKWCVPDNGASCPCNSKRDGIMNACSNTNSFGTCTGTETCDGKNAQWDCTALMPGMEVCNGKDDNCDGQIDEGDPNMLCAGMGNAPPHTNWACTNGKCSLGTCMPGWVSYPAGSNGCPCQVDAYEPDQSCAAAKDMGMTADVGGTPIVINGTLSSDTDVDVYTFKTVDVNEMTANSYHLSISFTQPMPNGEFLMDVEMGTSCTDMPTGGSANITSYDWCVNANMGTTGELMCAPATVGVPHCGDHSSTYYVRVHRKAGVTGTCTPYQVTITAAGGPCDLTQTCM